ncbi:hypothetical protein NN3_25030 [Nocardia neocaledoniensis NBRC 108232]|nr:hypothetical protein NN3_25030 [Nocardia neocaledoniensis NBRC 108232]
MLAAAAMLATVLAGCANSSAPSPTTAASPTLDQPGQEQTLMRIRLTAGTAEATGHLYSNATSRDFASLLPVTITTHDLGGREIAGPLPRALTGGDGRSDYRAGQLGYWSPSSDLAIYHHEDGFRIPSPGIVMIGEIETGLDAILAAAPDRPLTITTD